MHQRWCGWLRRADAMPEMQRERSFGLCLSCEWAHQNIEIRSISSEKLAERLRYNGKDLSMCTNPLSDYFGMGGQDPGFEFSCTALWRG